VEKQKIKEEELKDKIYEFYAKCYVEPSDRRQVNVVRLWEYASRWCKDYICKNDTELLYKEKELDSFLNGAGDEIYLTVDNFIKNDKIPKESFFGYFRRALINAVNNSHRDLSYKKHQDKKEIFAYRNSGGSGIVKPKIMKEIMKRIEIEERNEGRELSLDERAKRLSRVLLLSEKTLRKHLELIYKNNGNDILNPMEGRSLTTIETNSDLQMEDSVAGIIKDELENFLNKKQERTRDLYRALFTGICINNGIKYFQKIWPILDNEILEDYWKDPTVVPKDYEIYQKKRPGRKNKNSAGEGASTNLKILTEELQKAIIEKHPEIYSKFERMIYRDDRNMGNKQGNKIFENDIQNH